MPDQPDSPGSHGDQRPPSFGLGRIVIALFWLLGAWILVVAVVDLFHHNADEPWGPPILAGLGVPELNGPRSAWTGLGSDFYYAPLAVSLIGLVWMWRSNPRRIVEIAESIERPSRWQR